jgi:hypothetical protein
MNADVYASYSRGALTTHIILYINYKCRPSANAIIIIIFIGAGAASNQLIKKQTNIYKRNKSSLRRVVREWKSISSHAEEKISTHTHAIINNFALFVAAPEYKSNINKYNFCPKNDAMREQLVRAVLMPTYSSGKI